MTPVLNLPSDIEAQFFALKHASRGLRGFSDQIKSSLLLALAARLRQDAEIVLAANAIDLKNLSAGTQAAFVDRLTLNQSRIEDMAVSLVSVSKLPDPVGETVEERTLENGLKLRRTRAPLGVILMIFESRPNVILEAFSLAFKSGNAIALRGGSESSQTASAIYHLIADELRRHEIPAECFIGIRNYDRGLVEALLLRKDLIDVVVPRGGDKLIELVQKTALMPIIKNDRGLCHAFVDCAADLEMAVQVVANAKTGRPGVCNSLETVLVHELIAKEFLPKLYQQTRPQNLQWRCDPASREILKNLPHIADAVPADWDTEHLDLIINCRVVRGLSEALSHIETHGSKHSEAILTSDEQAARKFQSEVDAAAVYWNASTRFTDGYQFGLGGELGISTQKLHVRGPVGLRELTTPRWLIDGTGQIRT